MHKAPPRLVDDLEVTSALRNDVMHASDQHHAYAASYDSAGKLALFQAALLAGASPAAAAPLGASIVKGVIGVAGAVALMATGAAIHARWQASAHPAPAAQTASHAPATPAAPQALAAPAPAVAPAVTVREATPSAQATATSSTSARRGAALDATQQELRQLARIRARLQAKQPAQALQLAERANRELGESALWQEREGLAVLALFALDQTAEAERRARVLLDRFPSSPFRAELEQQLRLRHETNEP